MKTRKRGFLRTMVSALAIFMALTLAAPAALAKGYELDNFAGPDNLIYGGKFYSEFSSLDEVFEAAKKLNGEVVAEGTVLLKNNGTLPLDPRTDKISVLGILRLSYQVQHRAKKGKTLRALCVRMKLPHTN